MNALVHGFMFILTLSSGVATQVPNLGTQDQHSGHKKLVRKQAVIIDSTSVVQHLESVVSKENHSRQALMGKIEQGGKCLAAKRASHEHGVHELEMLDCGSSAVSDDEEWEATAVGAFGQIELADSTEHTMNLCLEADSSFDLVDLKTCAADSSTSEHERQLFMYDDKTNDIQIHESPTVKKCVTAHDHDSDGVLELKLEDCTVPVESKQEFVFEQPHHTLPASSGTMHSGKIKHTHSNKCIAAHKISTDAEDLEVVSCGGDGDDDEEWEADAAITSSHDAHAAQQIKLKNTVGESLCLTADSAHEEVELKPCHTHTHHHRQMWIHDEGEFKMEDPETAVVKCMATEPKAETAPAGPLAAEPDDNLILEDCVGSSDDDQEWEWD